MFPKIGVPQNGWFRMENPVKIFGNTLMAFFPEISFIFLFGIRGIGGGWFAVKGW